MIFLTAGKKVMCLITGISLLFGGSSFAQLFDSDDEVNSWVLNLWEPAPSTPSSGDSEWNIGGETTPVIATSSSSGAGGGRLGTADYSKRNRSTLITMERQALIAQEKNNVAEEIRLYASAIKEEGSPEITETKIASPSTLLKDAVANDYHETMPMDIVDHILIAQSGRDDLVTPYQAPVEKQSIVKAPVVNVTASTPTIRPRTYTQQSTRYTAPQRRKISTGTSIIIRSEAFPIEKTHLMSWNGMDDDIADYKFNVVKKVIINAFLLTGKILFFIGIIGIILALFFREKLSSFRRRKVRQLTLFSLLQ